MKQTIKEKIAFLIYPHQLYKEILLQNKSYKYFLIEDDLYFGDKKYNFKFHKKKLLLHRASMKNFYDLLKSKGFNVEYVEYNKNSHPNDLLKYIKSQDFKELIVYDPTDYILQLRIKKYAKKYDLEIEILESPNFITNKTIINDYFKNKKHFSMNSFYIFQRKRLNILVDENKKPIGGKWSYDTSNRKKLPKDIKLPKQLTFSYNNDFNDHIKYINDNFSSNYGTTDDFNYPIKHEQALNQLKYFIKVKFKLFGPYEDAISKDEVFLFHSNLSSSLNIGLLSVQQIIDEVLKNKDDISIESLEGFIRQIIGWREFMRATYILKGSTIRNSNFLGHTKKITSSLYNGTTGIDPVDDTIKKVLEHAYCHHIERLMILGNIMLLLQKDPTEIYKWFMEMFIDAYDWVMVPNVYSMSQFADGGLITTKPYFSSSNYVLKMSDYKKDNWCLIWDSLFYMFLSKHREIIKKNPRLSILVRNLDNKSDQMLKEYIKVSSIYLN